MTVTWIDVNDAALSLNTRRETCPDTPGNGQVNKELRCRTAINGDVPVDMYEILHISEVAYQITVHELDAEARVQSFQEPMRVHDEKHKSHDRRGKTHHTAATYNDDEKVRIALATQWMDAYEELEEAPIVWVFLEVDERLQSGDPIEAVKTRD